MRVLAWKLALLIFVGLHLILIPLAFVYDFVDRVLEDEYQRLLRDQRKREDDA